MAATRAMAAVGHHETGLYSGPEGGEPLRTLHHCNLQEHLFFRLHSRNELRVVNQNLVGRVIALRGIHRDSRRAKHHSVHLPASFVDNALGKVPAQRIAGHHKALAGRDAVEEIECHRKDVVLGDCPIRAWSPASARQIGIDTPPAASCLEGGSMLYISSWWSVCEPWT